MRPTPRSRFNFLRLWRHLRRIAIVLGGCLLVLALFLSVALIGGRSQPVDAVLVLGGSIRREIHAADVAIAHPKTSIIISQGSVPPCTYLVFQRVQAPIASVWLERCAQSTFGNFFFTLPILKQWSARHVLLITSERHAPRALGMGRIILGAHGIWLDPDIVQEPGVPGNQEFWLKTLLDLSRAMAWAIASHVYVPRCDAVVNLLDIDFDHWQQRSFTCERQGNIEIPESFDITPPEVTPAPKSPEPDR